MTKKIINIGSAVNDKSGDPLRTAFSKVNDNFTELYTTLAEGSALTSDRLVSGNHELVLATGGIGNPYVTFPEFEGGQVVIQSSEVGALGTNQPLVLSSSEGDVWIKTDSENQFLAWTFDKRGAFNVPTGNYQSFTAVLDTDHMSLPNPAVALDPMIPAWEIVVHFDVNANGSVDIRIDQIFPILTNPGYVTGYEFTFTEADHGIPGYTLSIALDQVVHPGGGGWTANPLFSPGPDIPSTVRAFGGIKLSSNASSWTFNNAGVLTLPAGGDIVDSTGTSVLGQKPSFEINTTNFPAVAGHRYGVNTTAGSVTATLPATPTLGDAIFLVDSHGMFASNMLIIDPNGNTIMTSSGNLNVNTNNENIGLFWNGTDWRYFA